MLTIKRFQFQIMALALITSALTALAAAASPVQGPGRETKIAWGEPVNGLQYGLAIQSPTTQPAAAAEADKGISLQVTLRNVGTTPVRFLASVHTCLLGEGGSNALVISKLVLKPKAGGDSVTLRYGGWNHLCLLDKRRKKSEGPQETLNRSYGNSDVQLSDEDAKHMTTVFAPGKTKVTEFELSPNDPHSWWEAEKPVTFKPGAYELTAVFTVDNASSEWKGEVSSAPVEIQIPQPAKLQK